jgi:hypothetical protein
MQSSHATSAVSAAFDDTNLVAHAGLVPGMRLAGRCGLARLVADKVKLSGAKNSAGAAADAKATSIVAGMVAGADSIDDLDVLRHGAMPARFEGIRAPSTLGTFLRAFTHGHALQLHAVHRRFLATLAAHTPLLPGAGEKAFIDVDSTHKRVYGRTKEGGEYGRFKGIRTLHPLLATICAPTSRPVLATVRMRRGKAADSRGAPKLVSEALATAVEAGCTGIRILRADSQFYNAGVIAVCRRAGARFSLTWGMNPSIKRAVLGIPEEAWQQIAYPTAVPDPDTGELISGAEVAEIPAYTAFAGRKKAERVTARLIVRRVRDLAKPAVVGEQGRLRAGRDVRTLEKQHLGRGGWGLSSLAGSPALLVAARQRGDGLGERLAGQSRERPPRTPTPSFCATAAGRGDRSRWPRSAGVARRQSREEVDHEAVPRASPTCGNSPMSPRAWRGGTEGLVTPRPGARNDGFRRW